jgi:hypothetical protein
MLALVYIAERTRSLASLRGDESDSGIDEDSAVRKPFGSSGPQPLLDSGPYGPLVSTRGHASNPLTMPARDLKGEFDHPVRPGTVVVKGINRGCLPSTCISIWCMYGMYSVFLNQSTGTLIALQADGLGGDGRAFVLSVNFKTHGQI